MKKRNWCVSVCIHYVTVTSIISKLNLILAISGERKCQKTGKKSHTQRVHKRYAVASVCVTTECYQKRLFQ